jgi:hypothetical protein
LVDAGADKFQCQGATPIALTGASVGGSATCGTWTMMPANAGTLSNTACTATPGTVTFTPDVLFTGSVVFTLTTNDPLGPCGAVSDQVMITINPNPSLTAALLHPSCGALANGHVVVTATGGTPTYTYAIAPVVGSQAANVFTGLPVNTYTFTVTDSKGCTATATKNTADVEAPTITCPASPYALYLDADGEASIDATVVTLVADNCGILSPVFVPSDEAIMNFNCSNIGNTTLTAQVTDAAGLTATCSFVVEVHDQLAPIINIKPDITVCLNANGDTEYNLVPATVENAAPTDNCAVASVTLSQTVFTCADILAASPVAVTYIATDVNGNVTQGVVNVTVRDCTNPTPACNANITLYASYNGAIWTALLNTSQVNAGNTDNCTVAGQQLYLPPFILGTVLTQNIGYDGLSAFLASVGVEYRYVGMLVSDQSGNTNYCEATVTILPPLSPLVQQTNTGNTQGVGATPATQNAGTSNPNVNTGSPVFDDFVTYPNPSESDVNIDFTLRQSSNVQVAIYDARGALVKTINNGDLRSGSQHFVWSCDSCAKGIYYVRLVTQDGVRTRMITLIR